MELLKNKKDTSMKIFTLRLTEESANFFQYRPGVKIGPFKINKIIGEYYIPKQPNKIEYSECECGRIITTYNVKAKVKIIEFECSYI